MPSHKTIRERQMIRDTSLPPFWRGHFCGECAEFRTDYEDFCFHRKYYKYFCLKWGRKVRPDKPARSCFVFRSVRPKRKFSLIQWLIMRDIQMGRIEPAPFVWKKGRCPNCPREHADFWFKAYTKNQTQKYCSKRCKREFKRFKKKSERNALVFRNGF